MSQFRDLPALTNPRLEGLRACVQLYVIENHLQIRGGSFPNATIRRAIAW